MNTSVPLFRQLPAPHAEPLVRGQRVSQAGGLGRAAATGGDGAMGRGAAELLPLGPPRRPILPEEWVMGLTGGKPAEAGLPISDVDTASWLADLPEGEPCQEVQEALNRALAALETDGSRYEAMRDGTWALAFKGRGACAR